MRHSSLHHLTNARVTLPVLYLSDRWSFGLRKTRIAEFESFLKRTHLIQFNCVHKMPYNQGSQI